MSQNFPFIPVNPGGSFSVLNVSAPGVVVNRKAVLFRIIVETVPSAGNLTINDLAANSGAGIANQILSLAFGALTAGQIITLEWPCANGIVISSVGTGGVYAVSGA